MLFHAVLWCSVPNLFLELFPARKGERKILWAEDQETEIVKWIGRSVSLRNCRTTIDTIRAVERMSVLLGTARLASFPASNTALH